MSSIAIITGSSGLIGSETAKFVHEKGMEVVGIDNNLRKYFLRRGWLHGVEHAQLKSSLKRFTHHPIDIRAEQQVFELFEKLGKNIGLVVHTAAQPSHDWAAREPLTDFSVNALGTLVMLEATRKYCPNAVFVFTLHQ